MLYPLGNTETEVNTLYKLTHHEFAGLAEVEHNVGPDSDYHLSEQLNKFVGLTRVWKLGVVERPAEFSNLPTNLSSSTLRARGESGSSMIYQCGAYSREEGDTIISSDGRQMNIYFQAMFLADRVNLQDWDSNTYGFCAYEKRIRNSNGPTYCPKHPKKLECTSGGQCNQQQQCQQQQVSQIGETSVDIAVCGRTLSELEYNLRLPRDCRRAWLILTGVTQQIQQQQQASHERRVEANKGPQRQ